MIDLHCHSIFSDGSCTPEELIALAEQAGLMALALTDHDTTDGLARFAAAAEQSSVTAVSGTELSAEFKGKDLHILGYGFEVDNKELQSALAWVREGREERNAQILEKLNALGYDVSYDDLRKHSGDDLIGRPHFAMALIEAGHFSHKDKVFRQLLGKNCAAYVARRRLTPEQCFELIRNAGGVPVLAHPGQLKLTVSKLRRQVRELKEQGLMGIEVVYPSHADHQVLAYERLCAELQLIPTGGSDFHGTFTPDLSLGTGFGDLNIPDSVLENLFSS